MLFFMTSLSLLFSGLLCFYAYSADLWRHLLQLMTEYLLSSNISVIHSLCSGFKAAAFSLLHCGIVSLIRHVTRDVLKSRNLSARAYVNAEALRALMPSGQFRCVPLLVSEKDELVIHASICQLV